MSTIQPTLAAPPEVYGRRRAMLAAKLTRPMVILAGRSRARNYPNNGYPFRPGSSYLYFGGPPLEGAGWLIEPGSDGDRGSRLLRIPATIDDAVWMGAPPSDDDLAAAAGVSPASLAAPDELAALLAGAETAFLSPPCIPSLAFAEKLGLKPASPEERLAIAELRHVKDDHELAAMRFAATVSVDAQLAAIKATKPGHTEADLAAALLAVYTAHRCDPSFTPIISIHGEVLHPHGYPHKLAPGRLLLCDAGCEGPTCYASDMTRVWPTEGTWTPIQRHLYDTVLRANSEAIAAAVPGRRFRDLHNLAARIIVEGLIAAELLKPGDPGQLVEQGVHTLFFTHGLGHLIGLDVHDMEDYGEDLIAYPPGRERAKRFGDKFLRLDHDLIPGMCCTIEPGLYLVPAIFQHDGLLGPHRDRINRPKVDALLRDNFGGIRVEDTICVRAIGGPEILTAAMPKAADDVAKLVGAA
jgi:Xaa-Pro aminopeptidase